MNSVPHFDLEMTTDYLQAAALVSLLSVWVVVGVFFYLNRYTKRRYFTIWNAAWLFYALWLTLGLCVDASLNRPLILMFKHWCLSSTAVFLLWGSVRFLGQRPRQTLFGLFTAFLFVLGYIDVYHFGDSWLMQLPVFGLVGFASVIAGICFAEFRKQRECLGAGLLSFGFVLWGFSLMAYPFLLSSEYLAGAGYFISAVLQLFIAAGMIVLVLEEVYLVNRDVQKRYQVVHEEKRELETRVSSTEARYRSVFDQASESIIVTDAEGLTILELNHAAERMLGIQRSQLDGENLIDFCRFVMPPELPLHSGSEWFEFISQQRELDAVHRDGHITSVEVSCSRITFAGGSACQFFFRALTEHARLEKQLRQAERLSALGQMISGVAHELNNPLAVVKGYLELVLARPELSPQTRADLEKVAHEGNRAAKLVSKFLSFAREETVSREKLDLNSLVRRAAEICALELATADVQLSVDLNSKIPTTLANRDQVQQVLVNLITNSLQALASQPAPRHLKLLTQRQGELMRLIVEDNGPGVPEHLVGKIFEPFFTTKEVGKGTGLGLSIAHSIMAEHHGRIFYRRSSLGGAAFVLEFPLVDVEADNYKSPQTDFIVKKHKESEVVKSARILVLDDEKSLAEMLGEVLTILGHEPTVCFSALSAVEQIQRQEFDLIFSDYRMPQMDGQDFYHIVAGKKPELAQRIIFLTGDLVNEKTRQFLQSISNPHLCKPFDVAAVEEVVANGLRRAATFVAAAGH